MSAIEPINVTVSVRSPWMVRVGAVAEPTVAATMRRLTPPWQLGLPAQLAAVAALRDVDHYPPLWQRTRPALT